MAKSDKNSEAASETPVATEAAPADSKATARFETIKIYLKDASFETPAAPAIFTQKDLKYDYGIKVEIGATALDDAQGLHDIALKLEVTAKHQDTTLYIAEVQQAGIFQVQHPDADTRQIVMEVTCPNILLPFAREALNNLITKGGFIAFMVAPVNFEGLFQSKKEKAEKAN